MYDPQQPGVKWLRVKGGDLALPCGLRLKMCLILDRARWKELPYSLRHPPDWCAAFHTCLSVRRMMMMIIFK